MRFKKDQTLDYGIRNRYFSAGCVKKSQSVLHFPQLDCLPVFRLDRLGGVFNWRQNPLAVVHVSLEIFYNHHFRSESGCKTADENIVRQNPIEANEAL
jgi:hypothetical protein